MLSKKIQAFLWLLLLTVLLCLPGQTLPDTGGNWFDRIYGDKWIHIFLFAMLTLLFCRTITAPGSRQHTRRLYAIIAVAGTGYGILMEFVQLWLISGRGFEIYDILADAAGCVVGYFFSVNKNKSSRPQDPSGR